MELGSIERTIHVDASPEVVFDVVSNPEHVREWWPDGAEYPAVPGGDGQPDLPDREVDGPRVRRERPVAAGQRGGHDQQHRQRTADEGQRAARCSRRLEAQRRRSHSCMSETLR